MTIKRPKRPRSDAIDTEPDNQWIEMMEQWIVITSIYQPTPGVKTFAGIAPRQVVVVGDKKTPGNWHYENVHFIGEDDQKAMTWRIVRDLPWNHYCRKMIGYLSAMAKGAHIIVDTDDDNVPKPHWRVPSFHGEYDTSAPGKNFINIYRSFSDQHIWPRGFPLNRIADRNTILTPGDLQKKRVRVGIWQGLADGDPDVDAIYRCTSNKPCFFEDRAPVVLDRGTICPINSQNTAFVQDMFPLLYLPAFVNFRFTDILRGLVAQPILWQHDRLLGFTQATVTQHRNEHDYMADFRSEIPCYLYAEKIVDIVSDRMTGGKSVADHLIGAYEQLYRNDIVEKKELHLLENWLRDVDAVS